MRDCKRVRSGEAGGSGVDGIQLRAGDRVPNKVRNIVGSNIDLHLIDLHFGPIAKVAKLNKIGTVERHPQRCSVRSAPAAFTGVLRGRVRR